MLVDEEISRLVGDAAKDGSHISAASTAAQVLKTYPTCGVDQRTLANRIMIAAALAGIAVKIGPAETVELRGRRA